MKLIKKVTIPFLVFLLSFGVGSKISDSAGVSNPSELKQTLRDIKTEKEEKSSKKQSLSKKVKKTDSELAKLLLIKEAVKKDKKSIRSEKEEVNAESKKISQAIEKSNEIIEQQKVADEKKQEQIRQEQVKQEQARQAQNNEAQQQNSRPQGDFNTATDNQGQIIGNSRTKIFHLPGQQGYNMSSANIVRFNSVEEAIAAGYRQSKR